MTRLLVVLPLIVLACREPSPPPAPARPAPAAAHDHTTEHAHEAPHGGLVQSTPDGHLELSVERGGAFKLWLLDQDLKTLPVAGATAKVKVALADYADVALSPAGDHLAGQGAPLSQEKFSAVVSVSAGGKGSSARFPIDLAAPAAHAHGGHDHGGHDHGGHDHGGHDHGGHSHGDAFVARIVDVGCLGRSDEAACTKGKLGSGSAIVVEEWDTKKRFRLQAAPGKSLADILREAPGFRVELSGTVDRSTEPGSMLVERVGVEHEHSSHHGGIVAMFGPTHLELLALLSGEVRVYFSDDFRRPLSAAGRSGTVEVTVGGAPKTAALVPDPSGAFLSGRVGPLPAGSHDFRFRLPMKEDPSYSVEARLEPLAAPTSGAPAPAAAPAVEAREVTIDVRNGYSPSRIVLKKGVPAKLTFVRQETSRCSEEVLIPEFGVQRKLGGLGVSTTIEVVPERAGEFEFTCGMEMLRGTVVVN